jgi:hypothetical protein
MFMITLDSLRQGVPNIHGSPPERHRDGEQDVIDFPPDVPRTPCRFVADVKNLSAS